MLIVQLEILVHIVQLAHLWKIMKQKGPYLLERSFHVGICNIVDYHYVLSLSIYWLNEPLLFL